MIRGVVYVIARTGLQSYFNLSSFHPEGSRNYNHNSGDNRTHRETEKFLPSCNDVYVQCENICNVYIITMQATKQTFGTKIGAERTGEILEVENENPASVYEPLIFQCRNRKTNTPLSKIKFLPGNLNLWYFTSKSPGSIKMC